MIEERTVRAIYDRLGDQESRRIFDERLAYYLTGNEAHLFHIVEGIPEAQYLRALLRRGECNYIFGCGRWGKAVAALAPEAVTGFIDNDPKKWGGVISPTGIPAYPPEKLKEETTARVFIAVHMLGTDWQNEIAEQLSNLNVQEERIIRVDRIIDNLDAQQYFDLPELPHDNHEVFVDGGAYTGDTILGFQRWAKHFDHIYAFEPEAGNRAICKKQLKVNRMTILPYGLWNRQEVLRFHTDKAQSCIDENGKEEINLVALDDVLSGKRVTFLKMDIEGAEQKALQGAAKTIQNYHPKLGICVYHKPEDICEIPAYILSLNQSYRFYLRHYSLWHTETILYGF